MFDTRTYFLHRTSMPFEFRSGELVLQLPTTPLCATSIAGLVTPLNKKCQFLSGAHFFTDMAFLLTKASGRCTIVTWKSVDIGSGQAAGGAGREVRPSFQLFVPKKTRPWRLKMKSLSAKERRKRSWALERGGKGGSREGGRVKLNRGKRWVVSCFLFKFDSFIYSVSFFSVFSSQIFYHWM